MALGVAARVLVVVADLEEILPIVSIRGLRTRSLVPDVELSINPVFPQAPFPAN